MRILNDALNESLKFISANDYANEFYDRWTPAAPTDEFTLEPDLVGSQGSALCGADLQLRKSYLS